MTPEQWYRYGGCPTCEAGRGKPCTTRRWGIGDDLDGPHAARPLYASPLDISRMLDEAVTVSVKEGVTVRPGDTLVVRIDAESLAQQEFEALAGDMEALRAHIEARLPRGARVVIIAADGQLGVVRAETEAAASPGRAETTAPGGQRGHVGPDHGCVPGTLPEGPPPVVASGPAERPWCAVVEGPCPGQCAPPGCRW